MSHPGSRIGGNGPLADKALVPIDDQITIAGFALASAFRFAKVGAVGASPVNRADCYTSGHGGSYAQEQ